MRNLSIVFAFGFYLLASSLGCIPSSSNITSLVVQSPFVFQGRVRRTEPPYAVFIVTVVYKGEHLSNDGAQRRILVDPFGPEEDSVNCVAGPVQEDSQFILFLSSTGLSKNVSGRILRRFTLVSLPIPLTTVAEDDVREALCTNCTTSTQSKSHTIPCLQSGYCLNSGTCYIMPTLGLRFCQCPLEFQGERCQEKRTMFSEKTDKTHDPKDMVREFFFVIVVGGLAAFLVLLVAVILLIIALRRVRTAKSRLDVGGSAPHPSVKYRNITSDPQVILATTDNLTIGRHQNQSQLHSVAVQTDPDFGNGSIKNDPGNSNIIRMTGSEPGTNGTVQLRLKNESPNRPDGGHRIEMMTNEDWSVAWNQVPHSSTVVSLPAKDAIPNKMRNSSTHAQPMDFTDQSDELWIPMKNRRNQQKNGDPFKTKRNTAGQGQGLLDSDEESTFV